MNLLDCSGVAARIYRLLGFILLRKGADSAVAVVVFQMEDCPCNQHSQSNVITL